MIGIEEKRSTAKFSVEGMDCASCTTKIETAVRRLPGVSEPQIGLQTQTLTVRVDSPDRRQSIEEAVRKLGYGVTSQGLKAVFLVTTVLGMTGLWIAILADTGATVLVTVNALRPLRTRF